jgi:hypothetical protein
MNIIMFILPLYFLCMAQLRVRTHTSFCSLQHTILCSFCPFLQPNDDQKLSSVEEDDVKLTTIAGGSGLPASMAES